MSTKRLSKTIIEGGRAKYQRYGERIETRCERFRTKAVLRRIALRQIDEDEDIWVGTYKAHDYDFPAFRDKLAPIYRWMEAQVGKPWAKVYSSIRKRFDVRTTAGRHIVFDHLLSDINRYFVPSDVTGYGGYSLTKFFTYDIDDQGIIRRR